MHRYTVSNLSVAGALLVDGPALQRGEQVEDHPAATAVPRGPRAPTS
ncbi:MAG: hypothetical protein U0168_31160 [Nannocystaceae bacterium]